MVGFLLSCAPLCVLAALLLRGRFVGEESILRRMRRRRAPRRRGAPRVRPRQVLVRSRLEHAPLSGRGPPPGRLLTT